jgi:membrane protein YdbS with pleckstrin-like domain
MSSDPNPKPSQPLDKLKGPMDRTLLPEELIWSGRYSAKSMIGLWILLSLITVAALFVVIFVESIRTNIMIRNAAVIILAIAWLIPIFQLGYRKLAHFYELTNQRLKHRDGILIRHNNRVEVIDIDDVSFRQGIIEAFFNVGTIFVKSSDASHPELVLRGISDVKRISDLIDNARLAERTRRGLYVESV